MVKNLLIIQGAAHAAALLKCTSQPARCTMQPLEQPSQSALDGAGAHNGPATPQVLPVPSLSNPNSLCHLLPAIAAAHLIHVAIVATLVPIAHLGLTTIAASTLVETTTTALVKPTAPTHVLVKTTAPAHALVVSAAAAAHALQQEVGKVSAGTILSLGASALHGSKQATKQLPARPLIGCVSCMET